MRIRVQSLPLTERELGFEAFDGIRAIYPEGCSGASVALRLSMDDARLPKILRTIAKAGFDVRLWRNPAGDNRDVVLQFVREYSGEEIDNFEYVEFPILKMDQISPDGGRRSEGSSDKIVLFASEARAAGSRMIAVSDVTAFLVRDPIKRAIEAAGLRGVGFRDVAVVGKRGPAIVVQKEDDRWWELTCDVVLPPMSPRAQLLNRKKQPVPRGTSDGVWVSDGLLFPPEPRYLRSDLAVVGPFDAARTHEAPRGSAHRDRPLIVSRAFRRIMEQFGVRIDWIPVHVEDAADL